MIFFRSPTFEKIVKGEGMPISKKPGEKGDLILRFNVTFPQYLSEQQKSIIKQVLKD